jgi:hypothetical protein
MMDTSVLPTPQVILGAALSKSTILTSALCIPNLRRECSGMSLSECAAAYSLTDSLSSEPATAAPTSVPSSLPAAISAAASTTAAVSSVETPSTTAAPYTTSTYVAYSTSAALGTGTTTVGGNVTASSSAAPVQFTGGANTNGKLVSGGLKGLAIAAGAVLVF